MQQKSVHDLCADTHSVLHFYALRISYILLSPHHTSPTSFFFSSTIYLLLLHVGLDVKYSKLADPNQVRNDRQNFRLTFQYQISWISIQRFSSCYLQTHVRTQWHNTLCDNAKQQTRSITHYLQPNVRSLLKHIRASISLNHMKLHGCPLRWNTNYILCP
jgi:hypothetical protein